MKRISLLFSAFLLMGMLLSTQAMAQGRINLNAAKSLQECTNITDDGFRATFSFNAIEANEVSTEKGVFSNLRMDGTYPAGNVGEPSLPAVHQLIAVPFGASNVSVKVLSYTTTQYSLNDYNIHTVMPQQPSVRKDMKPEDVKFVYSENAYAQKSLSERPLTYFETLGNMRGIQVGSLTINPVNYNPVDNTIEVYNDIQVEVSYNDYDKSAAEGEFLRTFSPYFYTVYRTMFNWRDDVYDQHPDLYQAPVKILVIANRMFEDCLQEWISWKTLKGFYMDVNYTDEIGTTASAIRQFIQQKYASDAPTFVIIAGDKNEVAASYTGTESHCVSDLQYMSIDNDLFPDMYHSRFTAENVQQMQTILDKTLLYERYQDLPDPSYLSNVLLIAGWDSYWTAYDGAPSIQYALNYYYNTEHGFNEINYWLGQPYTNCYASMNTGVGFVNYTAHGSNTSWADPSFTVSNVNSLTNVGKPFLAMGNCCQAADWGISSTCFGEAMIRANSAAAYAYIGSCPSTYWYEDYYFTVGATNVFGQMPTYEQTAYGIYDAVWDNDVFNTVSAMPFIGNIAVCYAHAGGYQGSVSDRYYWESYHVLGDGSVLPYRVQPTENTVSHMAIFPIGMSTYEVTAEPGSYVAVSKDGVLHGTGLVGESGVINLEVEPVLSAGDVTICVTGLDKIPYIATIPAAALEGAYVSVDTYATTGTPHVGDETELAITFKNVGTSAVSGESQVTLSCEDENLTILNGTGTFTGLDPEATVNVEGFTFKIAEGIADGTKFTINTLVTNGTDSWEGRVNVTACEAVLEYQNMAWAGSFVPGESVGVTFTIENTGHYMATNAYARLSTTSEMATIENDSIFIGNIDPTGNARVTFQINIDPTCPETEVINLIMNYASDGLLGGEVEETIKNSCNVVFNLVDSYGDGWNGNSLTVSFSDGTPTEQLTISEGNSASYTLEIGNGVHVTLGWISGSWTSECSFSVRYEDGDVICEANNLSASWSYEFDCSCGSGTPMTFDPITELAYAVEGLNLTLTWTAPEGATSYTITRNGVELGETTENTYVVELTDETVYTYCVIANYNNGIAVPECVTTEEDILDVNEINDRVSVYPNPVNNTLFIVCNSECSYVLYNGMGQEMASGTAQGTQSINVSEMPKGIYFLRLTTGTQVNVQKVVVE